MGFENMTPEQREKARVARTPEELEALAEKEGLPLSDEQLEAASGGRYPQCRMRVTCPSAHDLSGRPCKNYVFV
jgi:hypothetical protein